jgi:hypothetical protein
MSKEWGNAYWDLFHSLSFKLKSDDIVVELFKHFSILCSILPCPICRSHAIKYLSNIKKDSVNTRSRIIDIFYNFHNNVNKQLRKKQFTKEKYNILYNSKKLINVLTKFNYVYSKNNYHNTLDTNVLIRQNFLKKFVVFMKTNKDIFELN